MCLMVKEMANRDRRFLHVLSALMIRYIQSVCSASRRPNDKRIPQCAHPLALWRILTQRTRQTEQCSDAASRVRFLESRHPDLIAQQQVVQKPVNTAE
jgi:hypothetical protein